MSFKLVKEVKVSTLYPEYSLQVAQDSQELEITYTIESLDALTDAQGTANYSVAINGSKSPVLRSVFFEYTSGTNPIEAAEAYLKTLLA